MPTDKSDPTGLAAVVSKYGNDVYIVLTIAYTGNSASARSAIANAAIQNAWTLNTAGGLNVRTIIASTIADSPMALAAARAANMTIVNFVPNGDPHLTDSSRSNQTSSLGYWNDSAAPLEYAHEAGHIMRLEDRYTSPPYEVESGWAGNLTAQVPGSVDTRNIVGVLTNAGCLSNCVGNVIPNGNMTNNTPTNTGSGK